MKTDREDNEGNKKRQTSEGKKENEGYEVPFNWSSEKRSDRFGISPIDRPIDRKIDSDKYFSPPSVLGLLDFVLSRLLLLLLLLLLRATSALSAGRSQWHRVWL